MPSSSRHVTWLIAAVILIAVLVAFAPGLRTPFQYDDLSNVLENTTIRDLSNLRLALSPVANQTSTSGRPLLNLLFAVDYAITGLDAVGYHLTNLALHMACALLLYAIVRRTLRLPSVQWEAHSELIAAATAVIWAVHPLQIGVVTYISGRSESWMSVWYLATLLCAIHAHQSPHIRRWTAAAIVACAIGMGCKESMVTAPVAILLYDRAYLYRRVSDALSDRWPLYAGLAATWVIGIGLAVQAPRSDTAGFSTAITPWVYLLNQTVIIPDYLARVVWPHSLVFAYGESRPMTLADLEPIAVVVPICLAVTVWAWYRRPALGFPAVWAFLTLAPTSSIVPILTEAGAMRRMYLPLAGIVTLFVVGVMTVATRRTRLALPQLPAGLFVGLALAFALTTAVQTREFATPEQLWRGSAERWPSGLAHRNLAGVLLQQGRRREAIEELRAAVAFNPLVRYDLGVQLLNDGRTADAIPELRQAIQEFPDDPTVAVGGLRALGRALQKEGRHREAADVFGRLAATTPDDVAPQVTRADELLAAGDLLTAHQEYARILASHPEHAGALTNDGLTLLRLGRVEEALPLLKSAATRQPENARAYMNLASASAAAGRLADATVAACRARDLAPQDPSPRQLLADLQRAAITARITLPGC